jgi:hypothetical protein
MGSSLKIQKDVILKMATDEAKAALKEQATAFVAQIKGDALLVEDILEDMVVAGLTGDKALSKELVAQLASLAAKTKKKAAQAALDSLESSAMIAIKIVSKLLMAL